MKSVVPEEAVKVEFLTTARTPNMNPGKIWMVRIVYVYQDKGELVLHLNLDNSQIMNLAGKIPEELQKIIVERASCIRLGFSNNQQIHWHGDWLK